MLHSTMMIAANPFERRYLQTRNMRAEATAKLKDYDAIMGKVDQEIETLRSDGIPCKAFAESEHDPPEIIQVTRQCWNHVFKHPVKRQSKVEKLERALAWPSAIKLLRKTTTYQGVSVEQDKGSNTYLSFEICGCVRGNRIKGLSQNSGLLQGGIGELQMDKGQVIATLLAYPDRL